jgi:hypothetical protein
MAHKIFDTKRITTKTMYRMYIEEYSTVDAAVEWFICLEPEDKEKVVKKYYRKKVDKLSIADTKSIYQKEKLISYPTFKKIVTETHKEVVNECLKGGVYNFGEGIGTFEVTKHNREVYLDEEGNLKGTLPDYGATRKAKAAGNDVVIYHTNSLICRWQWSRKGNAIKNKCKWCIEPTNGPLGISRKLHHYIEENPRATMHYRLTEIKRKKDVKDS